MTSLSSGGRLVTSSRRVATRWSPKPTDQAAALHALARFNPDAVLLDVCLGTESGFHVSPALPRAPPRLSVLMVSAEARQGCANTSARAGRAVSWLKSRLAQVDLAAYWRGAEGLSGAGSGARTPAPAPLRAPEAAGASRAGRRGRRPRR